MELVIGIRKVRQMTFSIHWYYSGQVRIYCSNKVILKSHPLNISKFMLAVIWQLSLSLQQCPSHGITVIQAISTFKFLVFSVTVSGKKRSGIVCTFHYRGSKGSCVLTKAQTLEHIRLCRQTTVCPVRKRDTFYI